MARNEATQDEIFQEAMQRVEAVRHEGGTKLNLGGLGVGSLPSSRLLSLFDEIASLSNLTGLYLESNQLAHIPKQIGNLTNLTTLDLGDNQLAHIPEQIGNLTNLTTLCLDNNQLTHIPEQIGKLTNLTELSLHTNQLAQIPEQIGKLINLKGLFLHGNEALGIPPEVLGPEWHETILLQPCKEPADPQEILDYYFSTRGEKGQALREVKLIFVGRGEVGKSSMVEVLKTGKFVEGRAPTDGVNITHWPVKLKDGDATVKMWDFGGQEIMHGTHQFFLTHRSLYIVMVDGRHDHQKQDAEYWMKLVRAFGGDSTVLLVLNRQKHHPFDIDRNYIAQKYSVNLDHIFRTDCADAKSIKPLCKAIKAEAGRMLDKEELFPRRCWGVKSALETRADDYLSEEQYKEVCNGNGVTDEKAQKKLLRRLADLGTVVSFPDDDRLCELSVLNPEWATDGIYRVVTNQRLREEKHGKLSYRTLRGLLPRDRWPGKIQVDYIRDLMIKFNLCFRMPDAPDTVLVPELLPDQTPGLTDWKANEGMVFLYDYKVLPHGVLPRFLTRTHEMSEGRRRWRSGVELQSGGAEALIRADYAENTITIWVRGKHIDQRRDLLAVIREHFRAIHSHISGLDPTEKVAMRGFPNVLENHAALLADERDGKTSIRVTVNGKRQDVDINEFLNNVAAPAVRRKQAREKSEPHIHHHRETTTIYNSIDNSVKNNYGQVGQKLNNCTNMIQKQPPGDLRNSLEELEKQVRELIERLPEDDQKKKVAKNMELLAKEVAGDKPRLRWYEFSAEGLIEASKFAKDFTGNIAETIGQLRKIIWPG